MKIFDKILLLAVMFMFDACGNEEVIGSGKEPEKELKEYTISLKMGGEVTASDSPLARAETESNDLYGVQVYSDKTDYGYFAYGLFDNVSDMKINLLEGSTYKFVVLLVKDGKNKVKYYENTYGSGYKEPFRYSIRHNYSNVSTNNNKELSNSFEVVDYKYFDADMQKGYMDGTYYPEANWYYGELSNYTPEINGTVEIDLKQTVFGLQYEVTGITDGTVSVTIQNDKRTFFENSSIAEDYTSEEKIIAFYDVYNAWKYANNYTENLTVSVSWKRGVGVVQDLGSKTIQVKRNVMNVVRVKLGATDGNATFGITTEDDSEMKKESVDIALK